MATSQANLHFKQIYISSKFTRPIQGPSMSWAHPCQGPSMSRPIHVKAHPCHWPIHVKVHPCQGPSMSWAHPCQGPSMSWAHPCQSPSMSWAHPCHGPIQGPSMFSMLSQATFSLFLLVQFFSSVIIVFPVPWQGRPRARLLLLDWLVELAAKYHAALHAPPNALKSHQQLSQHLLRSPVSQLLTVVMLARNGICALDM